jgi:serine/threonine-protein kinase
MTTGTPETVNPLAGYDFAVSEPLLYKGERLGRDFTVIDEQLGKGGQARVIKAEDHRLGKQVALKLFAGLQDSNEHQGRAYRDAQTQHAMTESSPDLVVPYIDDGLIEHTWGNLYYLETEVMPETLKGRLRAEQVGGIGVAETVEVVGPVLEACADLHERQGLLYRDLSIANAFIDKKGKGRLSDFGTVIAESEEPKIVDILKVPSEVFISPLTQTGAGICAIQNTPPEIVHGDAGFSRQSDIYGAGALLHMSLTGTHHVKTTPTSGIHMRFLMKDYEPVPDQLEYAGMPNDLIELTMGCLEANPINRPQSMREVAQRLGQIAA